MRQHNNNLTNPLTFQPHSLHSVSSGAGPRDSSSARMDHVRIFHVRIRFERRCDLDQPQTNRAFLEDIPSQTVRAGAANPQLHPPRDAFYHLNHGFRHWTRHWLLLSRDRSWPAVQRDFGCRWCSRCLPADSKNLFFARRHETWLVMWPTQSRRRATQLSPNQTPTEG